MIEANANIGGQGFGDYHTAMQQAVFDGDASGLEDVAGRSGSDGATAVCYLYEAYDGQQPGGCPTMYFRDARVERMAAIHRAPTQVATPFNPLPLLRYFRDRGKVIKDLKQHRMWVMLEAGSGIVSQHDYDPESSCEGWNGCAFWSHGKPGAWWNVSRDPFDDHESPLWAFTKHRALNRLALRTKLDVRAGTPDICDFGGVAEWCAPLGEKRRADGSYAESIYLTAAELKEIAARPSNSSGGALAYLKHDSMGPTGAACIMIFNPGIAQSVSIDLSSLPPDRYGHVPIDLFTNMSGPPLASTWWVDMGAGEVRAYGGFSLGTFAPRAGKKTDCVADDGYRRPANATTLQGAFLECLKKPMCDNVYIEYATIGWMAAVQPLKMTLLGKVDDPSVACKPGTGTLVKKLVDGRPAAAATVPSKPTESEFEYPFPDDPKVVARVVRGSSSGWSCRGPWMWGMVIAIWALYFHVRRRSTSTSTAVVNVECGCSAWWKPWTLYFKVTDVEK